MADPNPSPDLLTFQTMYLCGVAYMADAALMPGLIEKTQVPPSGGVWKCLWGPEENSDDANLAFVAGYFPDPNLAAQFICVTIRGTDVDVDDISGILYQMWEDLDVADPQPMPWALKDPARIASGTLDGLRVIQGLADPTTGQTLTQFLTSFFAKPANANVKTVVTGHSLGGCLATVVAMWIRAQLLANYPGTIQPITFAAPTAGDSNFATYYDELFPQARRYQNTLDIIPLACYDLDAVNGIYANDMLETPDPIWLGILGMEAAFDITGASYAQPAQGQQLLPGSFFPDNSTDWYAQALHQHHLATYLGLLTGAPVDAAALPQPSVVHASKARLTRRLGSPRAALNRIKGL
jgi:triacylglycerol lipase